MRPSTRFPKIAAALSARVLSARVMTILTSARRAFAAPLCIGERSAPQRVHITVTKKLPDRSTLAGAVLAILVSGLIAGIITILTATQQVTAGSPEGAAVDRRPIGPQCSQQPWPYYEARCVRDLRPLEAQGRTPRIVTPERW